MKDFNNGPSKDNKIQDGVCPKCYGDGEYYDPEDHVIDECYMCNGTGKRIILS
jgi:DnaJ-class molecular chaperone